MASMTYCLPSVLSGASNLVRISGSTRVCDFDAECRCCRTAQDNRLGMSSLEQFLMAAPMNHSRTLLGGGIDLVILN